MDVDDQEIGEPVDLGFDFLLEPKILVIGGGFIEELLEEMKLRDNIDEYVYFDMIDYIDDAIYLNIREEEINRTDNPHLVDNGLLLFTDLTNTPIVDAEGMPMGVVKDVIIEGNQTYFIFSDPEFNQTMHKKGFGQKFEFKLHKSKFTYSHGLLAVSLTVKERDEKTFAQVVSKSRGKQLISLD